MEQIAAIHQLLGQLDSTVNDLITKEALMWYDLADDFEKRSAEMSASIRRQIIDHVLSQLSDIIKTAAEEVIAEGTDDGGELAQKNDYESYTLYISQRIGGVLSLPQHKETIYEIRTDPEEIVHLISREIESIYDEGPTGLAAFLELPENVDEVCSSMLDVITSMIHEKWSPKKHYKSPPSCVPDNALVAFLGCEPVKYHLTDLVKLFFIKCKNMGFLSERTILLNGDPMLQELFGPEVVSISVFNVASLIKSHTKKVTGIVSVTST